MIKRSRIISIIIWLLVSLLLMLSDFVAYAQDDTPQPTPGAANSVASVTTQTVEAVVVELANGTKLLICPLLRHPVNKISRKL